MRYSILVAAGAALTLAACGGAANEANTTGNATDAANAAAPVPEPAANMADPAANSIAAATPAAGAAPTKEFLVGKWGEAGDCSLPIEFKADGTMVGPFERWELNGAELTMVGNPEPFTLSVIDKDSMESRAGGKGEPRRLTRC